jgi:protein-tyrosine phosphatase
MLKGFIDIHCHILPGLDDGPSTIEESLKMAKMYASQGVHHVIATPHFINGTAWANSAKIVVQSVQKMQAVLNKNRINLIIHPGMEIACSFRMPDFFAQGILLPLGGKGNMFLLEPAFHGTQEELVASVQFMLRNNRVPIIAHPERISYFQSNPDDLLALINQGARIQLTMDSLLAPPQSRRHQLALRLVQTRQVHFLASDAHSSAGREPPGESVWCRLEELIGKECVQRLCVDNPHTLLMF